MQAGVKRHGWAETAGRFYTILKKNSASSTITVISAHPEIQDFWMELSAVSFQLNNCSISLLLIADR
jgi:hypothetical protein